MNSLIADNSVQTLKKYLSSGLSELYEEREAQNIIIELFRTYKNWSRIDVVTHSSDRLSESEMLSFHFALKRLRAGEPLQHITRLAWFYGRSFNVNEHTLIPRPETEELVQHVIARITLPNPIILDVGTGSGCIAISLKKEIPNAVVYAIDISENALELARKNAETLDAEIHFLQMDILHGKMIDQHFDIIVSNPPYIPFSEKVEMRKQVVDFEPHVALFVENENPLVFYERLADLSKTHLKPGGQVWAEIHENQSENLNSMLLEKNITRFETHLDLQGKKRMLHITSDPQ